MIQRQTFRSTVVAVAFLGLVSGIVVSGPAAAAKRKVAKVRSVELVPGEGGAALRLLADRPIEWSVSPQVGGVLEIHLHSVKLEDEVPLAFESPLGPVRGLAVTPLDTKPPSARIDVRTTAGLEYLAEPGATSLTFHLNAVGDTPPVAEAIRSAPVAPAPTPAVPPAAPAGSPVPEPTAEPESFEDFEWPEEAAEVPSAGPLVVDAPPAMEPAAEELPAVEAPAANEPEGKALRNIDVLSTSDPTRIRLQADSSLRYTLMAALTPPRFVVDLDATRSEAPARIMLAQGVVERVEVTTNVGGDGGVRVIFHLTKLITPRVERRPDGLHFVFPHY